MRTISKILTSILIGMLCPVSIVIAAPSSKPNIVLVLMDNLGYGELGSYGGGITRGAATPRLDALAQQGVRLTNLDLLQIKWV